MGLFPAYNKFARVNRPCVSAGWRTIMSDIKLRVPYSISLNRNKTRFNHLSLRGKRYRHRYDYVKHARKAAYHKRKYNLWYNNRF